MKIECFKLLLQVAIKSKENIQTETRKQYNTKHFIIRLTHANINGEALQLHTVYKEPYFFLPQVMQESVSLSVQVMCVHLNGHAVG